MKLAIKLSILLFINSMVADLMATTLANVEPIEVVERSDRVAFVQIVEARLKELIPEKEKIDHIPFCSVNVRAKIIHDYFGMEGSYIDFSTNGSIEVGEEYLVFLDEQDSEEWFRQSWWRSISKKEKLSEQTKSCLKESSKLKADSFPQRAIKLNYDGYLEFSLNNMLIPKEVEIKTDAVGSVISQYNDTLVKFKDFDKYLKALISSNKNLKKDAKKARLK